MNKKQAIIGFRLPCRFIMNLRLLKRSQLLWTNSTNKLTWKNSQKFHQFTANNKHNLKLSSAIKKVFIGESILFIVSCDVREWAEVDNPNHGSRGMCTRGGAPYMFCKPSSPFSLSA